jgi:hypothetical protein
VNYFKLSLGLAVIWVLSPSKALAAKRQVPFQYIAKLYSEALGRGPDQGGTAAAVNYFRTQGCNQTSLQNLGQWFFASPEYQALNYTSGSQVLTAYRTILNHDPDQAGYSYYQTRLQAKQITLPQLVNALYQSPEFANLRTRICDSDKPSYAFDGATAIAIGPLIDQNNLHQRLNSASYGAVVELPEQSLVRLTQPLVIPRGVTLQTRGQLMPNHYAQQARLVRSGAQWVGPLVQVLPGAQLNHLWIDGQRSALSTETVSAYAQSKYNVSMQGGTNTSVNYNRIGNSSGATHVEARNVPGNPIDSSEFQCRRNHILGNLIEAYTSRQAGNEWSDGLSIHCEDTEVAGNTVIDATDVAIIMFSYTNPWLGDRVIPQSSYVHDNQVINVGNSAFAALGVDPFFTWARNTLTNEPLEGDPPCDASGCKASRSFQGARMVRNLFWTGEEVAYEIGMAIGTRPWFSRNSYTGRGGEFSNNSTGILSARVDFGIVVSGMVDTTVQGNALNLTVTDSSLCPFTSEAAAKRRSGAWRSNNVGLGTGFATGSIQPGSADGYIIAPFSDCVGKRLNPVRSIWDFFRR